MPKVYLDENNELIVSTDVLMQVFNIKGKRMPNEWASQGCPKKGRNEWNLKDVIIWRGLGRQGEMVEQSSASRKLQADADYKHAKARQEEVRLQEMLGNLIPKTVVEEELSATVIDIRGSLMHLGPQIKTELHRSYPEISAEVGGIVDECVRKCLNRLAQGNNAGN